MKVLVANLGSTSFKYRLFDMDGEAQLARGGIERIGSEESRCFAEIGDHRQELTARVPDHAEAVRKCLAQLTDAEHGCLQEASEVSAIGFKAVHGGRLSGVVRIDEAVLTEMERMAEVAPAHNPPYVAAMRQLAAQLPEIPLVAAFETGFHQTIPPRNRYYAIPYAWSQDYGIQRWGFHGASHRYLATRVPEIVGRSDLRLISCHLGGSSSLCASRNGQSVATSMGMSPQTGLPQNNRVGDFDPFALPVLMQETGKSLAEVLDTIGNQGGLLGLSGGLSGDVPELEQAAAAGNEQAQLALDAYTSAVRHYLGAYLVELGGADVIAFSGGIGERGANIRRAICQNLEALGIVLDEQANANVSGETRISADDSRVQMWVVPTNEEVIVARQTRTLLEG